MLAALVPIRLVTVPNVIGLPILKAKIAVADARLTLGTVTERPHQTLHDRQVLEQSLDPGRLVLSQTEMRLVVAERRTA